MTHRQFIMIVVSGTLLAAGVACAAETTPPTDAQTTSKSATSHKPKARTVTKASVKPARAAVKRSTKPAAGTRSAAGTAPAKPAHGTGTTSTTEQANTLRH